MALTWTPEQVLALAPDASAARAGTGLSGARHWLILGCSADAAWGECQGSAAAPYQTCIDLNAPAFHCTCPSRKVPCKHSLGLFLTLTRERNEFHDQSLPKWVSDWLVARTKRSVQHKVASSKKDKSIDAKAQAKRAARREQHVAAGLADLERWLFDLVRGGLASAQTQPYSFWESRAARLVDAQAPGLARRVRELASVCASGEGWQERAVRQLARLHLLIEGYRHIENLPPEIQADIRSAIGWTQNQEALMNEAGARDQWIVLGQRIEQEENLRVLRTWLWGQQARRYALVLHFAHASQALEITLLPGSIYEADLIFFPSAFPLRALVQARRTSRKFDRAPEGMNVSAAIEIYANALARNPWLEHFPFVLRDVHPLRQHDAWIVRDAEGKCLPLHPRVSCGWSLCALSGGRPITVFGEWNGDYLLPLSTWAEGGFVQLETRPAL